jgi:hypothetical protein
VYIETTVVSSTAEDNTDAVEGGEGDNAMRVGRNGVGDSSKGRKGKY